MAQIPQNDWSSDTILARRENYYAQSQRSFMPYETPLIFRRGQGQYLWDELDNKYTDLLGMNADAAREARRQEWVLSSETLPASDWRTSARISPADW